MYCYEKNLISLSALIVLTHGQGQKDVSFPGDWFGKHIPDIKNGKIPEWILPLRDIQRRWYRKYWRKVHPRWETIDLVQESSGFRVWLQSMIENEEFEEWFPWPSTEAPIGLEDMDVVVMYSEGLFSYMGYHVGKSEERPENDSRRELLDWIFNNQLPRVNSDQYMSEFDEPKSPARLKKMANFLAAEARNFARKRTGDYSHAIDDYKVDLDYLYEKYYIGLFGFDKASNPEFEWPTFPEDYEVTEVSSPWIDTPLLKKGGHHKIWCPSVQRSTGTALRVFLGCPQLSATRTLQVIRLLQELEFNTKFFRGQVAKKPRFWRGFFWRLPLQGE